MDTERAAARLARRLLLAAATVLAVLLLAGPAAAAVTQRFADLESGNLSQFDNVNENGGTLSVVSGSAFDGTRGASLHQTSTTTGTHYTRAIWNLDDDRMLRAGDEFWWGAAIYPPSGFDAALDHDFSFLRLDNWATQAPENNGGVENRTYLYFNYNGSAWHLRRQEHYPDGRSPNVSLVGPVTMSENAWHWVEIHTRLSATDGQAINELYIDGQLKGSSTLHNYRDPYDRFRVGAASISDNQTQPFNFAFDRVSISTTPLGATNVPPATTDPSKKPKRPRARGSRAGRKPCRSMRRPRARSARGRQMAFSCRHRPQTRRWTRSI